MLKFEYDNDKSESNLIKHGIDFVKAQVLWADSGLVEAKVKSVEEPRFIVIGIISKKHWSAVITYRNANTVRIISVRRSRKKEVEIYESERL